MTTSQVLTTTTIVTASYAFHIVRTSDELEIKSKLDSELATMPESETRVHELSDSSSTGSLRISGSEAIWRRVNQLLQSTSGTTGQAEASGSYNGDSPRRLIASSHPNRHSSGDTWLRPELSGTSSSYPVRPLKTKKPSRFENRSSETGISSSRHPSARHSTTLRPTSLDHEASLYSSSKKGKSLIARHPYHHQHDSRHCQDESDGEPGYKGPIAVAEFDRMKKEIEALKETLHESKKSYKRQTKKLEEAKTELSTTVQGMHEKDIELRELRMKHQKNEELLSTIEASVQCQICMDLPDKPFALAPCGHVLCLPCLQEWFRKAPPTLDDMDIGPDELTDPQYILMRSKSCPSCRAVIGHRPVPVFMVKAVALALQKAKPSFPASFRSTSSGEPVDLDADPWQGIFPSSDEEADDDDEDEDTSAGESASEWERDFSRPNGWHSRRAQFSHIDTSDESEGEGEDDEHNNTGPLSDSDDEPETQTYVRPRWEPPSVSVDPDTYDFSEEADPSSTLKLLQRGCVWDMIQNYDLAYSHSSGIILSLRSLSRLYASDDEGEGEIGDVDGMNRLFLGWNVTLEEDDIDGEVFINELLEDMKTVPARWQMAPRMGVLGAMDVRRLVPEDEVEYYNTTDTEIWIDGEDS